MKITIFLLCIRTSRNICIRYAKVPPVQHWAQWNFYPNWLFRRLATEHF